jgi:hypothetical protein
VWYGSNCRERNDSAILLSCAESWLLIADILLDFKMLEPAAAEA